MISVVLIITILCLYLNHVNCNETELTCGKLPLDLELRFQRIVGGETVQHGQVPWQVMIVEKKLFGLVKSFKCGGVLISDQWVLTAAHCQPGMFGSIEAIIGQHELALPSSRKNASLVAVRSSRRVIVHKKYDPITLANDIALIELEAPVQYSSTIQPICLPDFDKDWTGHDGFVSGWGRQSHKGHQPSALQIVKVPIISNNKCESMYAEAGYSRKIDETALCAGYAEGGKDACEGDSGGPLTVKRTDGYWVLAGLVSNGIGCAEPNLPGVYTKV